MMCAGGARFFETPYSTLCDSCRRGEVLDKHAQPLTYGIDLMAPDFDRHPQLQHLVVYDTIVTAGELLFIPAGWAHQVRYRSSLSSSVCGLLTQQ